MMNRYKALKKILFTTKNPSHVAFSCAMGAFIAFSPFFGFHTIMAIVLSWLFSLNSLIVFGVSLLINNPWTMVPVYLSDYFFGLMVHDALGIPYFENPPFFNSLYYFFDQYLSMPVFYFWPFMIGGNLLSIIAFIVTYPIVLWLIHRYQREQASVKE